MIWIAAAFGIVLVLQVVCMSALFWTMTELKAMQKSTHSIQYVPADSEFQRLNEEIKQTLVKDDFESMN